MIFKRMKKDVELNGEPLPLHLTGEDGEVWMEFPGEVVAASRQAINRMMRTEPFPQCLSTISAVRQEGVTYLSRAIGTVLAEDMMERVCVLELNWWWPADYPSIMVNRPGIAEVLKGNATLEEAIMPTSMENLALIPAGNAAGDQISKFSGSDHLQEIIIALSEQYDHLILDLPSVITTSDAIPLAALGTGLCLIVRQGVTPPQRVQTALDDLDHLKIMGVILNQVNISTPSFILNYIAQD